MFWAKVFRILWGDLSCFCDDLCAQPLRDLLLAITFPHDDSFYLI
jgi:hypothetical protein